MRRAILLLLVVAGLLAAMLATHRLTAPPAVRTENAAGQFDAVRAKARLARVLGDQAPHPADTAASDRVRERLLAELRGLGLQPRVADRFACNRLMIGRATSCARVRNLLVTVGPPTGKHLLINSHYDSVPVGPGAADAGIGVATLLEVAALLKDQPLARPVTFLFNEGEELGLIGARSFLDADPLARQVDSLINLEARGVRGPVNMFETSVPNAAPIRLFARSVEHPVANSLAVSAYRQLPNFTDVNTFESRGWLTLNLAPVGNETRYHSAGDDLQALDGATLQHMGDQTLQLATALASGPAPAQVGGETLFMNFLTVGLIALPMWVGVVLLGGLLLAFIVVSWRRRALWRAMPLMLAAVVLGTGVAWLGLAAVGSIRPGMFWRAHQPWAEFAVYAGVVAVAVALLAAARRFEPRRLRAASWLLFMIVGGLFSLVAPGALIYFLLPPLIVALGMVAARWWKPAEPLAGIAAALLLYLTLGATLGLLEELLNSGPLWVFAPIGALVLLPWLVEAKPLVDRMGRRSLLAGAGALLVGAWAIAAAVPAYSADKQQQWTLQYVVDEQARQPVWSIVNDRAPLPTAFARFGRWEQLRVPALGNRLRWVAPARPEAGLVPARVLPAGIVSIPGGRRVRVRLQTNGADSVMLVADPGSAVVSAGAPGQLRRFDPKATGPTATLACTGRSCDGAVLEFQLRGNEPLPLLVVSTRWSLPASTAELVAARPPNARSQYLPDATILVSRLQL
ncbi:MAG: hypothetical protein AVDCRST_MAG62-1493 [uncultured Sphingomonas sp.]|uniref:Peptidase M28 domain-containing protein n=1 Tax=uncultured Sphingomonas sp. TaxID=158754 RepID=A0A6J4TL76_9SPHN|nr:MAG: hypothetical protein AVDCRST_MAG62-1493 [uncultured Sphingomonas sp.]